MLTADLASRLMDLEVYELKILTAISNGDSSVTFKSEPKRLKEHGYSIEQIPNGYLVSWGMIGYEYILMAIKAAKSGGKSRIVLEGKINETTYDSLEELGYSINEEDGNMTIFWSSCPDCGGNTKAQEGGGVSCLACSYWECY